ncbi:hypothetical protein S4A8_12177 [Salinisphaera sp. S4-8]|uniref:glycine zipper domain-containing protein n=1 Tax=Salinisphaera sp. S4-8 TaxID=633357 RepID=UPI003340A7ED
MNMSLRKSLTAATLVTALSGAPAMAWDDNTLSAALGGGVGGALGAAIGNEIGGNTGAMIGGAVGAAGGTMITNRNHRDDDRYYDRDYRRRGYDYGRYSRYRY